ncbi:MAG: UDP-3-O-(3-hydroxymyristoyl)glucosamine N-acyltransferase [Candidatus Korobacteraceae bacterium]
MAYTIEQVSAAVGCRIRGNASLLVTGVASLNSATGSDLSFVDDEKHLPRALASRAGALIVGEFGSEVLAAARSKPLLISSQPRLAFARAAAFLRAPAAYSPGIHPTAIVAASVQLGSNVSIGPHAVIEDNCVLGDHVHIGAGASIGRAVVLGDSCDIRANVIIYPGVRLGRGVVVHAGAVLGSDGFGYVRDHITGRYEQFPQIGTLEIGDDVEIGANTTIDRGALDATVIERGVKLDNLVHVGHNVRIGEDVVIAAQTGISGSSVIEKGAVVAGQVGIADHVRIEEGAILGAQCGVPSGKIIRGKGVVFWGTPARPIREYLKELAVLARLARKR